mgnify:CR=1 FL=1
MSGLLLSPHTMLMTLGLREAFMLHVDFTKHAEERLQQRGFRKADVDLVLKAASEIGPKVYVLTDQDAAREIQLRKQEIQNLERLRGATWTCRALVPPQVLV